MAENPIAKNEATAPAGIANDSPVIPVALSIKEAAQTLRVSRSFLWQAVKSGQLGHYRLGRRVLFGPQHLRAFLLARETDASRAA